MATCGRWLGRVAVASVAVAAIACGSDDSNSGNVGAGGRSSTQGTGGAPGSGGATASAATSGGAAGSGATGGVAGSRGTGASGNGGAGGGQAGSGGASVGGASGMGGTGSSGAAGQGGSANGGAGSAGGRIDAGLDGALADASRDRNLGADAGCPDVVGSYAVTSAQGCGPFSNTAPQTIEGASRSCRVRFVSDAGAGGLSAVNGEVDLGVDGRFSGAALLLGGQPRSPCSGAWDESAHTMTIVCSQGANSCTVVLTRK
jgi:hypothetical protein